MTRGRWYFWYETQSVRADGTKSAIVPRPPVTAPERSYFQSQGLSGAFPGGHFNCWGVPGRAAPAFRRTQIDDLVLIAPSAGLHGGGVQQIGVIKDLCPMEAYEASRILWPNTPYDRLFPYLFFFDTEIGDYPWFQFLEDLGLDGWPHGWYRSIKQSRFSKWGGSEGYLEFLRASWGFRPLPRTP